MNRTQRLETRPLPIAAVDRPRASGPHPTPVLIQIPAIPDLLCDASGRRSPHRSVRPGVRARRRRLRREVRWVGCASLAASVLALTFWIPWQLPARTVKTAAAPDQRPAELPGAETPRPPVVSIFVEPAALPRSEGEAPVVLPGYLLPDDGSEEPAHAGS